MTLEDRLISRIRATGPMKVADYMAECLWHPEFGYYSMRDPLGAAGDFTTAPEISQMFGELIGLALAQAWMDQRCPSPFVLAELGPGRGTLMADLLRATKGVPGFHDAATVALVEASGPLRKAQAAALKGHAPVWCNTAGDLPDGPLFLIANEFFDALPIRQFQRGPSGWHERLIAAGPDGLHFALGPEAPQHALADRLADTRDGDVVEICEPATPIMAEVAHRIGQHGGAALIIDYGGWHSLSDTLQALRDHKDCPPLDTPGDADLTAHVDFEPLASIASEAGCHPAPLTPQGVFLERLGITARAQALARGLQGSALETHIAAHRRLTHPDEMGNLFQVLGLTPGGAAPIAGTGT
ncbi:class I SAM-dependent methyltransferase [Chachezhania antarctica]|uniref:class I SAM-dependent methyltransferase n=1 Tax=Chachezhania antarctica TaxID=2340860 RepID=UPI000EAE00CB|nr:SAM-dependent methyltransferase [Chachezhania antarctica]